ncbi:hypothetical protein N7467_002843, partial [Penicillium canescens]
LNIRDLPNKLLLWIVSHLDSSAIFALNSNLLHLAVKYDNVSLTEVCPSTKLILMYFTEANLL